MNTLGTEDLGAMKKGDGRTLKNTRDSLLLRKFPEDIISSNDEVSIISDIDDDENYDAGNERIKGDFLGRTCLKTGYSLRRQMLLSFGAVSAVTIMIVMLISIVLTFITGNFTRNEIVEIFHDTSKYETSSSARYIAMFTTNKLSFNVIDFLHEVTRDRFTAYSDSDVLFNDSKNERNPYPLKSKLLPLDWDIKPHVNEKNHQEHVQDRWSVLKIHPNISTASSMYHMQGVCDPSQKNPGSNNYHPNCTEANNNVMTGGVVAPTPTNEQIARKAGDLDPILKSLFEYNNDVLDIGLYFRNSGAGSTVMFPHYPLSTGTYISIGCEWMRMNNSYDETKPIAPEEEINRCHPNGTIVSMREYNPLERAWCRDQALNPKKVHSSDLYLNSFDQRTWLITIGKAIYDKKTNEFIACTAASIDPSSIDRLLQDKQIKSKHFISLVSWKEGKVFSSPKWNISASSELTNISNKDLGIGVDKRLFKEMKTLVNFDSKWDPHHAQEKFNTTFQNGDMVVACYPVPPIPDSYDPTYSPYFIVIVSLKQENVYQMKDDIEKRIQDEVNILIKFSAVCGSIGLLLTLFIIFSTSSILTAPLKWMNSVSEQIVVSFGEESEGNINFQEKKIFRMTPKTEISELVEEFQRVVSNFSGKGGANVAVLARNEKMNSLDLLPVLEDLYRERKAPGFKFNYSYTSSSVVKSATGSVIRNESNSEAPIQIQSSDHCHRGSNIHTLDDYTKATHNAMDVTLKETWVLSSRLFRWIIALIVTPLLLTTLCISITTVYISTMRIPDIIMGAQENFLRFEADNLLTTTLYKALLTSEYMNHVFRDLHVLTRFAGWLLFGGIHTSGSFTDMVTGAEQCKTSPGKGTCALHNEVHCDCAWLDVNGRECRDYSEDTRHLQKNFFEGQAQDAWPNGDRNKTSFPKVDYAPDTTLWLENGPDRGLMEVPGHGNGSLAAGYESTYERVKAVSALSVVSIPLYNYHRIGDKHHGLFVGFEADGMLAGYKGCSSSHFDYPFFLSSVENNASVFNSDLCPIGKYGYDARCRGWYTGGKKVRDLFVTSAYLFASSNVTAQSCTLPLLHPSTQDLIGLALIDFILPQKMFDELKNNTQLGEGGFPVLITGRNSTADANTVIGPGYSPGTDVGISKLVIPHDLECTDKACKNQQDFGKIVENMQAGNSGKTKFTSTASDDSPQTFYISYAPVNAKRIYPINSSDFSRGVRPSTSLVYSLALVKSEESLLLPFQAAKKKIQYFVMGSNIVFFIIIAASTIIIIIFSLRVTASITNPIAHLLVLLRNIDKGYKVEIKVPTNTEGCKEILAILDTLETLHKSVNFANFFFSEGDLEMAYWILVDTLRLFKRLGNNKAIGVANNNLGNIMLIWYRSMQETKVSTIYGFSKDDIIKKGLVYFRDAIKLGEVEYDKFYEEEGWSPNCLAFMQHLSNRYFNRAIFHMTIKKDHTNPKEAERLGLRDLEISKNMDIEVADQFVEIGFSVNKVDKFELMLSRIRGHFSLMEIESFSTDELDTEDVIDELFKELQQALKHENTNLFNDVTPAGRMQQLDAELMRYAKIKKDSKQAAIIAIRMLVEDEYIWDVAMKRALTVLIDFVDAGESGLSEDTTSQTMEKLQAYLKNDDKNNNVIDSVSTFSTSKNTRAEKKISDLANLHIMKSSKALDLRSSLKSNQAFHGDFTVETF